MFAVLFCAGSDAWLSIGTDWYKPLGLNEYTSRLYRISSNEFPEESELQTLQGIVITGSPSDVTDPDPWIARLEKLIIHITEDYPHIKIIGCCFGAQIIAKALGGHVDKNKIGRFLFGTEELKVHTENIPTHLQQLDFPTSPLTMVSSHGYSVLQLPKNGVLLCSSKSNLNEMYSIGENIIAIQTHPEIPKSFALDIIAPSLLKKQLITPEEHSTAVKQLEEDATDRKTIFRFFRKFLGVTQQKKYAVLFCEKGPGFASANYSRKFIVRQLSSSRDENDPHWDVYRTLDGELPFDFEMYHGIVITGSAQSANDKDEWVLKLQDFIRELAAPGVQTKLFGVCFGAQAIAHALGGVVAHNPCGKCIYGSETIKFSPKLLVNGEEYETLQFSECHCECIQTLPEGAQLLASSESTAHEIFKIGDRILASQGHPESDRDTLFDLAIPDLLESGLITQQQVNDGNLSFTHRPLNNSVFLNYLRNFFDIEENVQQQQQQQ